MIITQATLDALRVTLSTVFEKAYAATEPWSTKLSTEVPSTTASNRYGWIAQSIVLREWLGPRQAVNLSEHAHTITNRKFEGTVEVDRDQIEDDNLGMYAGLIVPQLAQATKKHPDQLLKTLIQANAVGYDGKALFANDHPTYNGAGTYDNLFASSALSAANFNTNWSLMASYTGEDGQPLTVMPNLLIVPPQLRRTALEIVTGNSIAQAILNAAASDNVGGVAIDNVMKGWAEVLVIPELANEATTWYLADTTKPIKPFITQKRRAPEFVSRDNIQDPKVFDQEKFTYGVSYRGEVGPTLPFLIAKCTA
jgi:phage major head subunit gpT-like protein